MFANVNADGGGQVQEEHTDEALHPDRYPLSIELPTDEIEKTRIAIDQLVIPPEMVGQDIVFLVPVGVENSLHVFPPQPVLADALRNGDAVTLGLRTVRDEVLKLVDEPIDDHDLPWTGEMRETSKFQLLLTFSSP